MSITETYTITDSFAEAIIMFADIVGFTPLSTRLSATELVNFLNQIFSAFDRLVEQHDLEKIKTIGDAYMVVGGLPNCIHVSQATYELLQDKYHFEERGAIQVKSKGEMLTYLLKGRKTVEI